MQNFKGSALLALIILLLSSCSSSKTVLPYFVDISTVPDGEFIAGQYSPEIKPDDELLVTIQSSIPEATAHYNLPLTNPATRDAIVGYSSPQQQTYIVNSKGDITMPTLGVLHVAGMTTEQLQEKISAVVHKDVSDAVVRVQLVNFQVIVAGEVSRPSRLKVNRERFSVLDAISEAGDLTPYGERSNILIVREENGKRVFHHLNLNSSETFNSPYFYLQQNDYVYVQPNKIRESNAKYNQDNAFKLQVISTIVSATSVLASLVIALAVK